MNDLDLVLEANPASWIDRAELERRRSASMVDFEWRRFSCGQWSMGESSAISPVEWAACGQPGLEIPAGAGGVRIGVDVAYKHDTTALVAVWKPGREDIIEVHPPIVLTPPEDGTSLPIGDILGACVAYGDRWPKCTFVVDPQASGEFVAQRIDAEIPGVTVATHSQAHGPMCLASERLAGRIATGRIVHPADPTLSAHVLAAGVRTVDTRWRFTKPRGSALPIDACIALAMAGSSFSEPEKPSGIARFP